MNVVAVTDRAGKVVEPALLARAETVHRQLRPQLRADYVAQMQEIFAGGAEMVVVVMDDAVVGVAVFRLLVRSFTGRDIYCDDLVSDESKRSTGIGHMLMAHMDSVGRQRGCSALTLDSGTQRLQAHQFYFREGLTIPSFHFSKSLL